MKVSSQVVAGTNYFYNLRAHPGNDAVTITVFKSWEQNTPDSIAEVSQGHNTLQQGHSQQ